MHQKVWGCGEGQKLSRPKGLSSQGLSSERNPIGLVVLSLSFLCSPEEVIILRNHAVWSALPTVQGRVKPSPIPGPPLSRGKTLNREPGTHRVSANTLCRRTLTSNSKYWLKGERHHTRSTLSMSTPGRSLVCLWVTAGKRSLCIELYWLK